jgi:hypothetical protein
MINGQSSYALKYLKDTIVTARPGTLGIMTFTTSREAHSWAWAMESNIYDNWTSMFGYNLMVIKVEGIGRGQHPTFIASGVSADEIRSFYNKESDSYNSFTPPDDTMCYDQVRVLE